MNMDPKTVEKLEGKIEEAVAEIIVKMGLRRLPLLPSRHTIHLMAKAAVAVYEAADGELRPCATARGTGRGLIAFTQQPLLGTFDQQQVGGGTAKIVLSLHHDEFGASSSSSFEVPKRQTAPGCEPHGLRRPSDRR